MEPPHPAGRVFLVGAGPGDPGLLTLKGARCLQEAEVVLYDELVDRRLLALAPPSCERLYVGKRGGHKSLPQEELNALLVAQGQQGRRVVRLKGGDPFVFGRGGQEALALAEAGVPFEVVPGVSAAMGVAAYAGIPLTHRGLAAAAVLVTGEEDPAKPNPTLDWQQLARVEGTLVIYMGNRRLAQLCEALLKGGRAPTTPAAVIEWGTWPRQRSAVSTLEHLAEEAQRQQILPPSLAIIGEVVSLREQLNWFERRPLFGRQVLVTRSREQAGPLQALLEDQGAEVSLLPLLELAPPDDWGELDECLDQLARYAWVIFTSPNSVEFVWQRLHQRGKDTRAFGPARVAAVGKATAERLRARGLEPDLLPIDQSQEGLVAVFAGVEVAGQAILLPASAIGRVLLAEELTSRGAQVQQVVAYQNRPPAPGQVELPPALVEDRIEVVVFASPSSVSHFGAVLGEECARQVLGKATIACIGPTTAAAVAGLGLQAKIQPTDSSVPALVEAICAHYREQRQ
ncbi:MAG: uroporphyrinogen-III C-methyltransferase [Candidatus Latescibacteria bacterium]|nr:uroporphyrinogen-III C-methyltransferase [Candidatus Latescibacterota bacterium]